MVWQWLVVTVAVVDSDEMGSRSVEYDKVFWPRLGKWTTVACVTELIAKSKVFQRVSVEKHAIPSLFKNVRYQVRSTIADLPPHDAKGETDEGRQHILGT